MECTILLCSQVLQEIYDGCDASDREEYHVNEHEDELFLHVVLVSLGLAFVFFISRYHINECGDEHIVENKQYEWRNGICNLSFNIGAVDIKK